MAERSKANDSKSFNRQLFVGSNPTLSVFNSLLIDPHRAFLEDFRIYNKGLEFHIDPTSTLYVKNCGGGYGGG